MAYRPQTIKWEVFLPSLGRPSKFIDSKKIHKPLRSNRFFYKVPCESIGYLEVKLLFTSLALLLLTGSLQLTWRLRCGQYKILLTLVQSCYSVFMNMMFFLLNYACFSVKYWDLWASYKKRCWDVFLPFMSSSQPEITNWWLRLIKMADDEGIGCVTWEFMR